MWGYLSLGWEARPAGLPLASPVLLSSDVARSSATACWLSEPPRRLSVTLRVLSCPASSPRETESDGALGSPRDPGVRTIQVLGGFRLLLVPTASSSSSVASPNPSRSGEEQLGCRGAKFLPCLTACLFLLLCSEVFMVHITGVLLGHQAPAILNPVRHS
jgi:hypothetical protein